MRPDLPPGQDPTYDWIGIGTITSAHGIRGEVKVRPDTDFPERFEEAQTLTVLVPPGWPQITAPPPLPSPTPSAAAKASPGGRVPRPKSPGPKPPKGPAVPRAFKMEAVRPHKTMFLVKLEGVDDRNTADALRGLEIVVPRSEVKPLPEGAHYVFELEGLQVYTEEGEHLGVLREVLFTGGNDVYLVKGEREILVPAIKDVIREVDVPAGRMTVRLLEGL